MRSSSVRGGWSVPDRIKYREGYKYQISEDYCVQTAIMPPEFVLAPFIRLDVDGRLCILEGYAYDGPSGPAFDTKNFMRASAVHDCLYQLMRDGHLAESWRETADKEMYRLCREDGMWQIRAWWCYQAVRLGGASSAAPGARPVLTAP